tara:strand:- start:509 stop:739 length:231 start_codon:yes stop_codon:yes gene_type:complete
MDDFDPQAIKMLELSELIVNKISLNINNFSSDQINNLETMQESLDFHLVQDNLNNAINEAEHLNKYLDEICTSEEK